MKEFTEQLDSLKLARYEIRLKALDNAVLNALIGSALRGAFGHSLKKIACTMPHGECGRCVLQTACAYPTIFEPTSEKLKNAPRPFIFEPPVPPLTNNLAEDEVMKLGVQRDGQISFGLTIIGEAVEKLPYFVYALELLARNGIGAERSPFALESIWAKDLEGNVFRVYQPGTNYIEPHQEFQYSSKDFVENRSKSFNSKNKRLRLKFLTPLRIMRKGKLLTRLTFADIFKQASLRIKHLTDIYGKPLEYDYLKLMEKASGVEISNQNIWRYDYQRWTNRQKKKLRLDGMLGEIEFENEDFEEFMPFLILGEFLHIGSSSSFGLGKFEMF